MSKQITAQELGQLINQLLTNPEAVGEMFTEEKFSAFMTDLARVVTDHCGGEVRNPASPLDDVWYVGVHGNDSRPPGGGVWAEFDKEVDSKSTLEPWFAGCFCRKRTVTRHAGGV